MRRMLSWVFGLLLVVILAIVVASITGVLRIEVTLPPAETHS